MTILYALLVLLFTVLVATITTPHRPYYIVIHLLSDWIYDIDLMDGSISRASLYHCTLWASNKSLKVGKCVGLMDMFGMLY